MNSHGVVSHDNGHVNLGKLVPLEVHGRVGNAKSNTFRCRNGLIRFSSMASRLGGLDKLVNTSWPF